MIIPISRFVIKSEGHCMDVKIQTQVELSLLISYCCAFVKVWIQMTVVIDVILPLNLLIVIETIVEIHLSSSFIILSIVLTGFQNCHSFTGIKGWSNLD